MSRTAAPDPAAVRNTAREQLISSTAAKWARAAAAQTFQRTQACTAEQTREMLEDLALSIVMEARKRFPDDAHLAELWREAANEAACAQLTAAADGGVAALG